MTDNLPVSLMAAAALAIVTPAVAQTPPGPPSATIAAAPAPARTFPRGAEVLSVEGEPLGVLAEVEERPGGERILHIRKVDGSITTAPAVMASRGERAVVLEWTREEFEAGGSNAATAADEAAASPVPPTL